MDADEAADGDVSPHEAAAEDERLEAANKVEACNGGGGARDPTHPTQLPVGAKDTRTTLQTTSATAIFVMAVKPSIAAGRIHVHGGTNVYQSLRK